MTHKLEPEQGTKGDVASQDKKKSWFYSDVVKEHFFNPQNFIRDEVDEKQFNAIGKVGSPACGDELRVWMQVDPATERIRQFKWKTFGSLVASERILLSDYSCVDVQDLTDTSFVLDGEGYPNQVESLFKKKYTGEVITIRLSTSSYYTFTLTPIHPIPCLEREAVCHPKRKSGHWSEVHQRLIEKANVVIKPAFELKEGDFLIYKPDPDVIDLVELDEDFCTLLGYYVSDGFRASPNRIRFDFGLAEEEFINEIVKIAKRKRISYRVFKRTDANILCIQLMNREIVSLLVKHGGGPNKKRFSQNIMKLPPKKQSMVIESYVKGDGWISKQSINWNEQYFISTSLEHLAHQIQMLLARNKIFAPIHHRESREFTIRGKTYSNQGEYNLIFKKNQKYSRIKFSRKDGNFLIPIQKIIRHQYKGMIYDVGLKKPPFLYRVKGISIHNCGSAIASTSMASVMVTENGGMTLDEARKLKPQDIMERLGGLPQRKFHCSVLCDKALRDAINDFYRREGKFDKITVEAFRVIDPVSKVTDHDIEEAVLEGAQTLEAVQQKTKVGIGNPNCLPAVEELIRFYKEKYFG